MASCATNHAKQSDRTAFLESVVGKNTEAQSQRSASLETAVAENKEAHSNALAAAVSAFQNKLASLKLETDTELKAAKDRLALLERSLWRKFGDSLNAIVKRLHSGTRK